VVKNGSVRLPAPLAAAGDVLSLERNPEGLPRLAGRLAIATGIQIGFEVATALIGNFRVCRPGGLRFPLPRHRINSWELYRSPARESRAPDVNAVHRSTLRGRVLPFDLA